MALPETWRSRSIRSIALCAAAVTAASTAQAHFLVFDFVLVPSQVVPGAPSSAIGVGHVVYSHHTGLFSIDITVWGVHTADLTGAGPNNVPAYIFVGDPGQNGDPIVDFTYFKPTPWTDTPDGMELHMSAVFLGGEQGNLNSDIVVNNEAMSTFRTYIQVFTSSCPGGELRGQILPKPGAPCPADRDMDGFVTGDDYDLYVRLFELGASLADFNNDGFVNGDDFDEFVIAFEAGC